MVAVITPLQSRWSTARTALWPVMVWQGFFKVFITDIFSFPGDHPNSCHKSALPEVTLGKVYKNTFFFIRAGNLT